ncbi:MAG: CoA transferase [Chloroflexi bacterium]|nr:CoA transferase [Chloroflexota bacterium]
MLLDTLTKPLALENIRVIDLTRYWAGPFGTQLLGAMGAEVIRVESADHIDPVRYMFPPNGDPGEKPYDRGAYFHMGNRNKDSVVLDLQDDRGRELLLELVSIADVVIENFSARVMGNLGLEYETLRRARPDIIALSMPSFGGEGPYRDYVCFGEALEAMTGLSHLTGYPDGPPMRSSGAFTDPASGLWAVYAILAALQHRNRTGQGCYVNMSQQEGYITLMGDMVMDFTMNGRVRSRMGNRHPSRAPQGVYPCRGDDRWVGISVETDEEWQALCRVMGHPGLARDSRFKHLLGRIGHHDELDDIIREWTSGLDHYRVMKLLQDAGVASGAVLTGEEVFADPHLVDRGFFEESDHPNVGRLPHFGIPVKLSETPGGTLSPAPLFGQHNRRVFGEVLGLSDNEYDDLLAAGVTAEEPAFSGADEEGAI